MFGMYESSPKVKCREGMCGAFQWIAELQIPSRDRVPISPRSCVDFVRARKPRSCVDFAEIVCRFRQVIDWGTLEIGSDLEKSSPRWRIIGRERKSTMSSSKNQQQQLEESAESAGERSTGPVDRPQ